MLDKRVRVPAVSAPGGSSPPSGTTGRLWRFLSRVGWLFGLFGTVVLALASVDPVLNVLYTIRPDLRPEGPPVLRSVTLGEPVLEERGVPCYDGARCNRVGFDIEFQGYQRDRVEIAWAAFDPVTLRRVDLDATGAPPPGQDEVASIAVAEAATDRASHTIDVPIPKAGACIMVRVSLYELQDDNTTRGTRLDTADTPPFHTHDPRVSCPITGEPTSSS